MSPIRIDFYLLTSTQPDAVGLVTCRLLEKAYQRGHKVFVYCDDQQTAEALDELLWTFKDDAFIPHHLAGEGPEPPPPVQIAYKSEPRGFNDILINLSKNIPDFYTRFRRVIEIVPSDEMAKAISREHYRVYRASGCALNTHPISE